MVYTYEFLHKNTEPSLWNKCVDMYDEYVPVQQGGPLMLCLILHRIQNYSEQALSVLVTQLSSLRLAKIEGEDVEYAVRLIKATYTVLRNASSLNRHYVPREFTKTVFEFFQTSSVPEFNATFLDEQRKLQVQADKDGVQPVWPSLTVVCRLATVTYRRLKANVTSCSS